MDYHISERYNCVILELKGKVMGGPDAEVFRNAIHQLIEKNKKNIVVDLGKVKFMNSSGLGILIGGLRTVRENDGDIKLSNADKKISSLLMVSQLNRIFDLYPSVEEAISAYK